MPRARAPVHLRPRGETDEPLAADRPPCVGERCIALADVHAVGARRVNEVGPVVQDEERAVRVARAPERLGSAHEIVVPERLVTQLHDVDAAA